MTAVFSGGFRLQTRGAVARAWACATAREDRSASVAGASVTNLVDELRTAVDA